MRHLRDVRDHRFSRDILTCCKGKLRLCILEFRRLDQIPEHDRTVFLIWNLNADSRFSRNRRFDTDIRCRQIQLDIIGKTHNLAYLHTHFRLKLIPGDGRSAAYIRDRRIHPEIVQNFLKLLCRFSQVSIRISLGFPTATLQKLQWGKMILLFNRCFLLIDFMLNIDNPALNFLL